VSYVHVVFTLPHALLPLGYRNARTALHVALPAEAQRRSSRSLRTRGI